MEYSTVVDGCFSISNLPEPEQSYDFLETNGQCLTLYKELKCTGDYIALDNNHALERRQIPLADRSWWDFEGGAWWEPDVETGSTTPDNSGRSTTSAPLPCSHRRMPFKSIGPCLEECDPRNIEIDFGKALNVTVYKSFFVDDTNHDPTVLSLSYGECIAFPTAIKRKVRSTDGLGGGAGLHRNA